MTDKAQEIIDKIHNELTTGGSTDNYADFLIKSLKQELSTTDSDIVVHAGSQVERDKLDYKDGLCSGHRYLKSLENFFEVVKSKSNQNNKGEEK